MSGNNAAPDEWIAPIIEDLASAEILRRVRRAAGKGSLWGAAIKSSLVDEKELLDAASRRIKTPVATSLASTPEARAVIPEKVARQFHVLPLSVSSHTLDIATANPWDLDTERSLSFLSGRSVRMWLASPAQLAERIEAVYSRRLSAPEEPVVRLVDRIVAAGIEQRASDIHLEPEEDGIAVRYRIDGILRHSMLLPKAVGVPLVSRIKIMAKMDIADRLRPQGGHASVGVGSSRVDLRVSSIPASHGEKVVIRILDSRSQSWSLGSLGLHSTDAVRLNDLLLSREGLILITGPTGSGKTTTLYAALKEIQRKGLNIVTVEDPVEYRIPGIVQVQINERAGLGFAAALRSILRQDPDVVLIGEIRDAETAAIAVQASLTGHLVFATLHTNDAAGAVTRLTDLGVDASRLAAGLKGVVAQRLVRRLCSQCRIVANDGVPARLRPALGSAEMVYTPVGCEMCGNTGYRGRIAIMEIATPAERLQGLTAPSSIGTLWTSGLAHLLAGETSGDELLRVLDGESLPPLVDSRGRTSQQAPIEMTQVTPDVVDVYVIRPRPEGWQVLVLQRALDTRCPGSWETVHGHLEQDETPQDGAVREVLEETGLDVARLYNVTVQAFFLHTVNTVKMSVVFAAFVDEPANVVLGAEHQKHEWLSPHDASSRFVWPREKEALLHILQLLAGGTAGPVEDVLRVF